MFIGHFALGMGAKKIAPAVSLGTLFLACQLADLLWPTLVLLGFESFRIQPGITVVTPLDFVSYPFSHSLVALLLWGALLSLGYLALRRSPSRWVSAAVLGALVLSHWVLDFLTHRPDMPVTLGGPTRLGLGLWNSLPGTLAVELLLFAAGVALYTRATEPRDRQGSVGFWALVAFLLIVYFANFFSPPPPSVAAVAWTAQAVWLLVLWGYWVDRHRRPRAA
ncbi:MAG TPA: hypothetical protein VLE27_15695 [Thermoanaerobaculia bacterium]|nr:hypothetical protein [Thermoanaerobaculia bacterium]